jgi:predicted DNA-binding transcriptional regulator YafY
MRADRLLAELTLLQARGRMTAAELALELEVTERTVYRDMYALRVAGVPLVAERGRSGGYSLYGDWRSDLTALTSRELESLLVAAASSPGTRTRSRSATAAAKLAAMLPPRQADELARLRRRIHVVLPDEPGEMIAGTVGRALIEALRGSKVVSLELQRLRARRVERPAHPIGLIIDGRDWYLVWHAGDGRPRIDGLDAILRAEVTAEHSVDFGAVDLAAIWSDRRQARSDKQYRVLLRMDDRLVDRWRERYPVISERTANGATEVVTAFDWIIEARTAVLPWGGAIEVVSPAALRLSVADFARQAAAVYEGS